MVSANQIRENIIRHLKWDNSLQGAKIQVDYVGKTAILTGTVPNLVAHEIAQRDALSIPGVTEVENRLTVAFNHDHPNKTDTQLRKDIQTVLGCMVDFKPGQIEIGVIDGIVTLTGCVEAYWKKLRAEEFAESVDGVLEIKNNIKVECAEKTPDAAIKRDIEGALARMQVSSLAKLKVEVNKGVVSFSGSVPTWESAFDVEDTARFTAGVTGVKNNLKVD